MVWEHLAKWRETFSGECRRSFGRVPFVDSDYTSVCAEFREFDVAIEAQRLLTVSRSWRRSRPGLGEHGHQRLPLPRITVLR
jgi:hypothetical protein